MSVSARRAPRPPIAQAINDVIGELLQLKAQVPRIVGNPDAADYLARRDVGQRIGKICDLLIEALPTDMRCDAIDASYFQNVVSDALEHHGLLGQFEIAAANARQRENRAALGSV